MGFYYDQGHQQQGFYYDGKAREQQQGFYYGSPAQQQGFYYDAKPQKQGFYYDGKAQQQGFYYDGKAQQQGFYYDGKAQQQGFYYDQADKVNHAAEWKSNKSAAKVMGAAKKFATEKVAEVLIANSAPPGATEARIQSQISAERLAYEATEIFMNETAPNATMTAEEIRTAILTTVTKAVSA